MRPVKTPEQWLAESKGYLAACAEGLCKRSPVALLPLELEQIARNLGSLAKSAERALQTVTEPDDY